MKNTHNTQSIQHTANAGITFFPWNLYHIHLTFSVRKTFSRCHEYSITEVKYCKQQPQQFLSVRGNWNLWKNTSLNDIQWNSLNDSNSIHLEGGVNVCISKFLFVRRIFLLLLVCRAMFQNESEMTISVRWPHLTVSSSKIVLMKECQLKYAIRRQWV